MAQERLASLETGAAYPPHMPYYAQQPQKQVKKRCAKGVGVFGEGKKIAGDFFAANPPNLGSGVKLQPCTSPSGSDRPEGNSLQLQSRRGLRARPTCLTTVSNPQNTYKKE
uniref:Uncharacterized protein n=1 Tax=Eutreptiella gymnastica TaxID=73025 RepID=A0A7S1IU74_9EUGL